MSRKRVFSFWLLGAIVLFAAVGYGIHTLNQPAEGVIVAPLNTVANKAPQNQTLDTTYFTASYPSRYEQAASPAQGTSASLAAYILIAHQYGIDDPSAKMTVVVAKVPAGGVTEDSGYLLYKSRPDLYTLENLTFSGDSVVQATRTNPTFERIVLWPHDKYLLTLTITSNDELPTLDTDIADLAKSIHWK